MRRLILLRHAKSSWSDPTLDDFDRPLNKRGRRDAPFMAKLFKNKNIIPDIIISSPSERTKLTITEFIETLNYDKRNLRWDKQLYLASATKLLGIIKNLNENYSTIMIVGHNPGLTDLQNILCKDKIDNIPTCGLVCMKTHFNWKDIEADCFELEFFEYPKKHLK